MASRGSICCRKNARCSVARGGESVARSLSFRHFTLYAHRTTRYTPDGASQRGSRVVPTSFRFSSARARRSPHAHLAHHIIVLASSRVLDSTLPVQPLPYTRARARRCPRARAIRSSLSPVNTTRPIFLVFLVVSALLFTRAVLYFSRSPLVRIRLLHGKLGGKGRHRRVVRAAALGRRALRLSLGHRHGRLHPHSRG